MRHKLFHTIVLSGLNLGLEGCAQSHGRQTDPPDGGMPDSPSSDALPDMQSMDALPHDGGPAIDIFVHDAPVPDAGNDAMDSGPDVFPVDVQGDERFCEPGWPPTKGIRVCQVVDEEGIAVLRCTYRWGEDMEPDFSSATQCDVAIANPEEAWVPPDREGLDVERIVCTIETPERQCRIERSSGQERIVCPDASCILTDELRSGVTAR